MKRYFGYIMMFLFACMLTGCSGETGETIQEGDYYLYYTNVEETGLERETYDAAETTAEGLIEELLDELAAVPKVSSHMNLLTDDLKVDSYEYLDGNVELNMSESYGSMSKTKEILVRAGLVRTLVQIDGVETVTFLVKGEPLLDSKGVEIGPLNAESFIENSGKEINSYMSTTINLYFSDADGQMLVAEGRKLYYSSNVTLERVVGEQIVKGPKSEDCMPAVSSDTKVLGVTVVDHICYVNLSKEFGEHTLNVVQELPIYSIVNSIIANCDVDQVQISVEGESDYTFRESMDLSQPFRKNTDLIQ